MKKRLLSTLLVGATFSLVACGAKETSESNENEASTEVVESTAEETETTEAPETEESEKESVKVASVEGCERYQYNYWYISTEDEPDIIHVWDMDTKSMLGQIDETSYEIGWNSLYGTTEMKENTLVDVTTGEVILELPENQSFWYLEDIYEYDCEMEQHDQWTSDGCALVLQKDESFEGNTYSIGVVNTKGEWLSQSMTQVDFMNNGTNFQTFYAGDGIFMIEVDKEDSDSFSYYVYDSVNGTCNLVVDDAWNGWANGVTGNMCSINIEYEPYDNVYYQYDITTGELKQIPDVTWENYAGYVDSKYVVTWEDGLYRMHSADGVVAEYDMSQYSGGINIERMTTERAFSVITNKDESRFACLLNVDGTMEFEPINVSDFANGNVDFDECCYFKNNKLVAWGDSDNGTGVFVYDVDTKEMVNKELPYIIEKYLPENGVFLVEAEHPEYGLGNYYVNVTDVDTLINPFDK